MTEKGKAWIGAIRPRTLPLAAGGIILGSFLPETETQFTWIIFVLALLTAFGLQILSNLANDYGDFVKGTDNDRRIGPTRALQSGAITRSGMKKALVICALLTLLCGISLLAFSFGPEQFFTALIMFLLGLLAIWAALRYTMGNKPYGYAGWGDFFVILFFGLVSVLGVSFLHTGVFEPTLLFPALSYGFLSAGVLNINNMRDIENDRESGKRTLVVRMGARMARWYHLVLILAAFLCLVVYLFLLEVFCLDTPSEYHQHLALLSFLPVLIVTIRVLGVGPNPADFNPLLKAMALSTLAQAIAFVLVLEWILN